MVWRRWEGRHPTGIDRVCLAYLEHYGRDAQAVIQHRRMRRIFDREASTRLFDLLQQPSHKFRRELVSAGLRAALRQNCRAERRPYLNIGHTGLNDSGFRSWVRSAGVRPVYFVHDLIPITHPQFCRAGEREKHIERMRTVLGTGAGVIGNSRETLVELSRFATAEDLPDPRAIAAPLGSTPLPRTPNNPPLDRPFFVVLGTIEARKNHLMLLQVWLRMIESFGERAPRLFIVGQRGWECEQVFDLLDNDHRLSNFVIEISRCNDEELAHYLANARALLFPSFIEGYGLPLVEALQAGTPVIASDLSVFREIAGDVPDYLASVDEPAWQRAILDYATQQSAARNAQLKRLADYKAPTWDDHFAAVDSWLGTL